MIDLEGKSVIECCNIILKNWGQAITSESLQARIHNFGGPFVKVSTVERKCRESDKIRPVPVEGKRWVKYTYVG